MRALTTVNTTEPPAVSPLPEPTRLRAALTGVIRWASAQLDRDSRPRLTRLQLGVISAAILLSAVGVRLLCWQDSYAEIARNGSWNSAIARHYESEARRMLNEGGILFPNTPVDAGDARPILHPPGYSAFMAGVFALSGDSISSMRLAQIVVDGLSAVLVLLIAAELFPCAVAIISALLVVLSPHFAFYSLWISPDTLCVLPVLVAIYLIIKASKRPRLITIIAAGAMVGVSCWLRANALLLAPFLAAVVLLMFEKGKRLGYAIALVGATLLVISPITIRNWILFHHFIPISIAGGENLVVGIADFDKEGRFGMPASDREAAIKDAQWHNRPDYAINPWDPDGVERDQARYGRGLQVIRANPGWFLSVMFKRALFMLRYNDAGRSDWPFNTAGVPIVSAEPSFLHSQVTAREMQPSWSSAGRALLADDSVISKGAPLTVESDGQTLRVTGDGSEYGDQFASAVITVRPKTDYVIRLRAGLENGQVAAKVTSSDRRIALASAILNNESTKANKKKRDVVPVEPVTETETRMSEFEMAFATGDRSEVRLVISNNGPAPSPPVARLGKVELFDLGATPYQWTRLPRTLVRDLQKNIFNTRVLLTLVIGGVLLLTLARRGSALAALLSVPIYYLLVQSALSTEYRYILGIHYFLFVVAGVMLGCLGSALGQASRAVVRVNRKLEPNSPPMREGAA
ncbi:MAG TPA: glycosyltransferase family 39 protein [Blastocatellia bacterium]|nr:glycosyltransferase family 39 protein [Blastocatellia bacterium]